jgi:hypothetical protein
MANHRTMTKNHLNTLQGVLDNLCWYGESVHRDGLPYTEYFEAIYASFNIALGEIEEPYTYSKHDLWRAISNKGKNGAGPQDSSSDDSLQG